MQRCKLPRRECQELRHRFAGGSSVQWVSASLTISHGALNGLIVDDDPVVEQADVQFASGVHGIITSAGGIDVELACERGEVILAADGWQLHVNRPTHLSGGYYLDRRTLIGAHEPEGTAAAIRTLVKAIRGQESTPYGIDQALEGRRLLFSMVSSELRKGERVNPQDVAPGLTVTGRLGEQYA